MSAKDSYANTLATRYKMSRPFIELVDKRISEQIAKGKMMLVIDLPHVEEVNLVWDWLVHYYTKLGYRTEFRKNAKNERRVICLQWDQFND